MTPPAKFAAVTLLQCSGTSVAANIRTTFRGRPMGLISWAWTKLALSARITRWIIGPEARGRLNVATRVHDVSRGVAGMKQRKFTTLMNLESGKLVITASSI